MLTREQAWDIVCEFPESEGLRKHALAVETCVVAYAKQLGEDEQKWSVTALLHDFDWEIHPQLPDHPMLGEPILAERGVDEESAAPFSRMPISAAYRASPPSKRRSTPRRTSGLHHRHLLVKPTRSVLEVDVASVKKKMKDKAFARSVDRQDIILGAQELGRPPGRTHRFLRHAMQSRAAELGLAGSCATSVSRLLERAVHHHGTAITIAMYSNGGNSGDRRRHHHRSARAGCTSRSWTSPGRPLLAWRESAPSRRRQARGRSVSCRSMGAGRYSCR